MSNKYTNVALPEDLIQKIDAVVKSAGLGYTSRGEVVKEAVRNFLKNQVDYKTQKK